MDPFALEPTKSDMSLPQIYQSGDVLKMPLNETRKAMSRCISEISDLRRLNNMYKQKIQRQYTKIIELSEQQEIQRNKNLDNPPENVYTVCRLCLGAKEEMQEIDPCELMDSKIPTLFMEVTNGELIISNEYSDFYCKDCINLLTRSAQAIHNFRDVDAFWKNCLRQNTIVPHNDLSENDFVTEFKVEFLDNEEEDGFPIDGLDTETPHFAANHEGTTITSDDGIILPDEEDMEENETHSAIDEYMKDTEEAVVDNMKDVITPFPYSCIDCHSAFSTRSRLHQHSRTHHRVAPFECYICKKRYIRRYGLKKHFRYHTVNETFACDKCPKTFPFLEYLQKHQTIHNKRPKDMRKCPQCDKVFGTEMYLKKHINYVHGHEDPSQCMQCNKVFKNEHRLKNHMLLHIEKTLQCDMCQRMYSTKKYLRNHMLQVHNSHQAFICENCGNTFKTGDALRRHRSIPDCSKHKPMAAPNLNPMKCGLCPRSCSAFKNMRSHYISMHPSVDWKMEALKYCRRCNKKFSTAEEQQEHSLTHSNLQCPMCKKVFICDASLRSHLKTHSTKERPFSCGLCGATFVRLMDVQIHIRRHKNVRPYKCEHCGKCFTEKFELTAHTKMVHLRERRFACHCGVSYNTKSSLTTHMTTHTKEYKWQCQKCGMRFFVASQLVEHIASVHDGEE